VIILAIDLGINVSANVSGAVGNLRNIDSWTNRLKTKIKGLWNNLKQLNVTGARTWGYVLSISLNIINFFNTLFEAVAGSTNFLLRTIIGFVSTITSTLYMVSAALSAGGYTTYYGVILAISTGAVQMMTTILVQMQQENLAVMLNYTQSMFNDLALMMRF